jgi:hypothetical protein
MTVFIRVGLCALILGIAGCDATSSGPTVPPIPAPSAAATSSAGDNSKVPQSPADRKAKRSDTTAAEL